MKRTAKKMMNLVCDLFNWLVGAIMIISIGCMDSENFYIPLIAMLISGSWLCFVAWLNGYFDNNY